MLPHVRVRRRYLARDLLIFQLKLSLDGIKDVVLSPVATVLLALLEIVLPSRRRGRFFYGIMRLGERFDLWLNLYGASRRIDVTGLFGGSRAGAPTFLGRLEELIIGQDAK